MSGVRRLFLDEAPGERRGVVWLDGRPERLLIARDGEDGVRVGERRVGRLGARGPGGGAWVELGEGPPGWIARAPAGLAQGCAFALEVQAQAHGDKGPRVSWSAPAQGPPRLLAAVPDLLVRLADFADAPVEAGREAREAADAAEAEALATVHRLAGGLVLTIQPTRALASVDVDTSAATPRAVQEANLRAIRHAARLLRLKALGGTVVIDLVGARPAAGLMRAEAARAFAADGPEVRVLPPDSLGLLAVARPHRERPLAEALLDGDGRPTARTQAQRVLRELQRELAVRPGVLFELRCSCDVAAEAAPFVGALGSRVRLVAGLAPGRTGADIVAV